jgi:hypothetical protein
MAKRVACGFLVLTALLFLMNCNLPTDTSGITGMDVVGKGYDIFDTFADRTKVKEPVLDVASLNAAGRIENIALESSTYESISGTDISTYSSSLMMDIGISGSYMGFSGSIKTAFSQSRYTSSDYSYSTVKIDTSKYALVITDRHMVSALKDYLASPFSERLNNVDYTPEVLFLTYGTHVMTGIIVGARLDYNVSALTSTITGGKSIGVFAEASYKQALMNVAVTASGVSAAEFSTYAASEERKLRAFGGSSEYAISIATKSDYDSWLQSIAANPVFCNYYPDSLIPIWEFCDDADRRNEIETAFQTWAEDRKILQVTVPVVKKAITGINVYNQDLGDSQDIGGVRYYKIYQDLNEGASGKFIYIYAAIGLDDGSGLPPITALKLWDSTDEPSNQPSLSFTMINQDLNQGADGDYIFLYYSTSPSEGAPIRALCLYDATDNTRDYSKNASSTQIYSDVPNTAGCRQDLNEGASGDYIYLMYSRNLID